MTLQITKKLTIHDLKHSIRMRESRGFPRDIPSAEHERCLKENPAFLSSYGILTFFLKNDFSNRENRVLLSLLNRNSQVWLSLLKRENRTRFSLFNRENRVWFSLYNRESRTPLSLSERESQNICALSVFTPNTQGRLTKC